MCTARIVSASVWLPPTATGENYAMSSLAAPTAAPMLRTTGPRNRAIQIQCLEETSIKQNAKHSGYAAENSKSGKRSEGRYRIIGH